MKKVLLSLIIFITMFVVVGCQVKTHEVRFNYNNGQEETVEKVNNGEFISKLIEPIKDEFVFKGWFEDDFEFTSETKVFRNYNLVAKWDVQNILTYQVILKYNNGNEDLHFNVNVGESINEIIAPVKEGYKFIGWYLNDELFSFDTLVTKDLVLEAKYEVFEEVKIYDVTLIYNNGLDNQTINVVENSTLIELKEPTRDGYIFLGWYLNELEFPIDTKITSNNIILTAKWEKKIVVTTYDVILKYDNGMQDVKLVVEENSILDSLNDPIKPAYNFIGWFVEDEKYDFNSKVVTDLTIVAKYELIVVDVYHLVTLIFDNGFTNQTFNVKENTLIKDLIEPTKEGYIFIGWYLDEELFNHNTDKITEETVLVAKWEEIIVVNKYDVTIKYNNGIEDLILSIEENLTVQSLQDPSKVGYNFIGWYVDDVLFDFNTLVTSPIIIEAKYEEIIIEISYEVTLIYNNGHEDIKFKINKDTVIEGLTNPTKTGFNFIGWYLDGQLFDLENEKITKDITLVANWEETIVVKTYKVTFKFENGIQDLVETVEENNLLTKPNNPNKPGYTFIGWFIDDEEYNFLNIVETDLIITAKYEEIKINVYYQVTLLFNNGLEDQKFNVLEDTHINKLVDPTKEGYIFLGWHLNDIIFDYTNEVISNDIILEAKWEEIYVEVNYTITYNLNNGLKDIIVVVNENDIVSKPENPSRIGYIFIGWFLDDIEFIFNNHINSDLTIDAHWVKETVKYNVEIVLDNGQQNISYRVIEFEKVTKPQDPVKNGYNFIGWYLGDNVYDFNSEVTSNIRIEARYRLLTSQDKVVRAIQLHKEATNFTIVGKGTVSTRLLFTVTQNINIKKSRNGDQIYLFNATHSSMANTFAEYDGTINSGNASVGNVDKYFKKTGTPNTEIKSYDDHITKYGGGVNDNNYIINYDTITNINEVSNNKFNLTLSLTDSIENYKTNISSMNPYENKKESIKFSKINITITLNEIGYFETIEYDEVYQLELNAPVVNWKNQTMTSKITETYTYNN